MRRTVAVAAALASLSATALAGVVLRVTPRELADTSHLVVEGRVDRIDVRWDEGRTAINTWVTLVVDRVHKGTAGGTVSIKCPGGIVGDEELRVEGVAKFEKGERCMAFLWRDIHGDYQVLGEAQGRFVLSDDGRDGKRMATNSLDGLCLVVRGGPKALNAPSTRSPDRLLYDDLVAVVRASVAGDAPAPVTGGGGAVDTTPGSPRPDGDDGTTTEGPVPTGGDEDTVVPEGGDAPVDATTPPVTSPSEPATTTADATPAGTSPDSVAATTEAPKPLVLEAALDTPVRGLLRTSGGARTYIEFRAKEILTAASPEGPARVRYTLRFCTEDGESTTEMRFVTAPDAVGDEPVVTPIDEVSAGEPFQRTFVSGDGARWTLHATVEVTEARSVRFTLRGEREEPARTE